MGGAKVAASRTDHIQTMFDDFGGDSPLVNIYKKLFKIAIYS